MEPRRPGASLRRAAPQGPHRNEPRPTPGVRPHRDARAASEHHLRAPLRLGAGTYVVHTQPGLEGVAWAEVEARFAAAAAKRASTSGSRDPGPACVRELGRRIVPGRAGMCFFAASTPDPLSSMRTAEELFAVVGYRDGLALDSGVVERIRGVARDAPWLEPAFNARVRLVPGSRSGTRLRFRVITRMVGAHEFRRSELQRAVERGITERIDRSLRLVDAEADVEFWATLLEDEFVLMLRLSDESLRQREYKVAHIPGSLRESVAAALGVLSRPEPDDIVLDPFCGASTVLIERSHMGRYRLLIGGDTDNRALEAARTNVGTRYKPIELHNWNATSIPLPDHHVDRIITNLPWGLKHGSHRGNRQLYPRLLAEFARLLRPGGVAVMLTSESRLMAELLRTGPLRLEQTLRVTILGARASIYVCAA